MAIFDLDTQEYKVNGARVGIVSARFNHEIVEKLVAAAMETLGDNGIEEKAIQIIRVPGAFELPLATQTLARKGEFEAVLAFGAIIRGGTPHFEYVAGECTRGLGQVALDEQLPVLFGVLTTDDQAQALARCGGSDGNKGHEVAVAALEMITLMRQLGEERRNG